MTSLPEPRPIIRGQQVYLRFEDGHAEFGIAIGEKSEWNKGHGTDALRAICDFGFGQLRLVRISRAASITTSMS